MVDVVGAPAGWAGFRAARKSFLIFLVLSEVVELPALIIIKSRSRGADKDEDVVE